MTIQPAGGGGGSGGGGSGGGGVARSDSSGLADVMDTILDKGLVIDAYVRASLVGIELLTIDARVVVASVDTYLRFADAVDRLEISENEPQGLPDLVGDIASGGAKHKTKGALEAAGEKVGDFLGEVQEQGQTARRPRRGED
ncbi:gas vesicle protein GvpJ [Rhodococcus sp. (in: high G+C Gram-positive bacteria)]|uniref:gas vesicle protein GvpJ n=1 Tax=unclassified Rhodococcus (in: high G+C Gram-positive bacteria) TaxID=192944 RepID=UPI0019E0CFA5|nr:gas vesicle protein GvpJ [Rhodococcus sp. (in: high G+C Gram-positive bacteria)]MBF0660847.1 gas vesicle structural protein GvpA [Rhodococcus sp. (in: high G+C Gram-positive bacteria)]